MNPERVRQLTNPFRVSLDLELIPQDSRECSNPGLKLANAFGVNSQNASALIRERLRH
jgi:hypothetical protein